MSLLLPAMFASRFKQKNPASNEDVSFELRLPSLLNRTFEAVMNVERKLITLGMKFPIGGSLLLVASKPETPV